MKKSLLLLWLVIGVQFISAQKVINYPKIASGNIQGIITKIEFGSKETVLHFKINNRAGWFSIPDQTYIEDVAKGGRLYVKKAEGIALNQRIEGTSGDVSFKLFFPPLPKGVKDINYGESNEGGNWYINRISLQNTNTASKIFNGRLVRPIGPLKVHGAHRYANPMEVVETNGESDISVGVDELPNEFFGNWYNRYGTLMLIATPEYIVTNNLVFYYRSIRKRENGKYMISHTGGQIEVLSLKGNKMSMRNDRLHSFVSKPINVKLPKNLIGRWKNTKSSVYLSATDIDFKIINPRSDIINNKANIVNVTTSKLGSGEDYYWLVFHIEGEYFIGKIFTDKDGYILELVNSRNRLSKVE